MKRSSLAARLVISTLLVVSITCVVCAVGALYIATKWISDEAAHQAVEQSSQAISHIATIDQLTRGQVETGMHILEELSRVKGAPSVNGEAVVNGKSVPNLRLGAESQVLNFTMVDQVKQLAGGTATLFAWDGNNFIRVTTNVLKPDGSRAVGTILDPHGKAFAALSRGQSFGGVVEILGVPYTTSYVPMVDGQGKLAGAWYTGYRLDSIDALGKTIEDAAILEHGFVALLKPSGAAVFHGKQISDDGFTQLRDHTRGWLMHEEAYPSWGYTVLTAYPTSDVLMLELKILMLPAAATLLMVGLIIAVQLLLLNRLVLRPVVDLTSHLNTADLNTLLATDRTDEIGALATSFNHYVLRLRQTLRLVRDGSAETSGRSDAIRSISQTAVKRMAEQCRSAEDTAAALAELSQGIAAISNHTLDASREARAAANSAREGSALVTSAVTHIQELSRDTQQSVSRISGLSERAKQIGSIVGVIQEIAAGTNLLALNASIEAARAGEHGRGFAVVAGEVRRLSERTAQATKQVSTLVNGIADDTEATAGGIDSARKHAEEGAETVASLKTTFERIVEIVIEVDSRVHQIAEAANRESGVATSVCDTMHQVAASAKQSASGAEEVVAATGELLVTARSLESMVEQFHLKDLPQDFAA